ncbi:hypothetical protein Vretimale_13327 [Volvox reticuliferus]|uniref:5'-deoxynucleotidase n=1 Tax=Volvox reticuliferus TaxID=1737510 RepID=A0A8J4CPC7_9CHLO|nr:hypothetical protein Vretifemale_14072 [Volvox reticuliferus]GIM09469.1 hypothetical protein Vretimale_13327 [Volvox reticuliferus]
MLHPATFRVSHLASRVSRSLTCISRLRTYSLQNSNFERKRQYIVSINRSIVQEMSLSTSNGSQPNPAGAIDFLLLLQQLKLTKRTGWVRKNVNGPESIADHMYRMSMMALIATDSGVDVTRCIKMALVHDVAEAIVGDITPHCGVSDEDKHQRELAAVRRIKEMLGPDTAAGCEVESLWLEYEAAASPEALLVKDFDKLEMILTAHQYEQTQPGLVLEEFFASTAGRFKTETGKAWAAELVARRCTARDSTVSQAAAEDEGMHSAGAGEEGQETGRKRARSNDDVHGE